jgi:hypothetical protein
MALCDQSAHPRDHQNTDLIDDIGLHRARAVEIEPLGQGDFAANVIQHADTHLDEGLEPRNLVMRDREGDVNKRSAVAAVRELKVEDDLVRGSQGGEKGLKM